MATVEVKHTVNAPVQAVWDSWDAFADIHQYHPDVTASYLLADSAPTGLGALRQCDFADGKNFLRERIIGYRPEEQLQIEIYESSVPLKSAIATISMKGLKETSTEVTMRMDFVPKLGLIGRMLAPMMKKQFRRGIEGLLAGNATFVETRRAA